MVSTTEGIVKLFPKEDGADIKVSLLGQVWIKGYSSISEATSDAVILGLLRASEKPVVDLIHRRPDYPQGWKAKAQVELPTLAKNGFRQE